MNPLTPLESHRQLSRPDLVVTLGYGDELPVFTRARAFWQFYASHFPNIEFIFVRDSPKLRPGEVLFNGYDLLIGTFPKRISQENYANTGKWAIAENVHQIQRHVILYDYLLRTKPAPFFLYQTTMTSVIDFRGLVAALEHLPATGCYGGMPGRLSAPPEMAGLTFCSGANTLLSRDVVALLRDRYREHSPSAHFPNDVWQALELQDVPRRLLPHFSFTLARHAGQHNDIPDKVRTLLNYGHFHFRVRTLSQEAGLARREDIDPWLQMKIAETLLHTPVTPSATHRLLDSLAHFCNLQPGQTLPPMTQEVFYNDEKRTFPIKEEDLTAITELA